MGDKDDNGWTWQRNGGSSVPYTIGSISLINLDMMRGLVIRELDWAPAVTQQGRAAITGYRGKNRSWIGKVIGPRERRTWWDKLLFLEIVEQAVYWEVQEKHTSIPSSMTSNLSVSDQQHIPFLNYTRYFWRLIALPSTSFSSLDQYHCQPLQYQSPNPPPPHIFTSWTPRDFIW